ncbi:hypothetical protein CASFOL_018121 [Castilleja foliolosa]|uniref:Uncharacterized protein n=1 Tax=Castilleja foliolosa TaxID=1961234 RepID=A0ABD3D5Y3_9LAMI
MKLLFLIMLVSVSLLWGSSYLAEATAFAPAPAPSAVDCNELCGLRCAKAGNEKRCLKYCKICCSKCQCVPSGTYGHRSECPCYRDMLNSKGKLKCP